MAGVDVGGGASSRRKKGSKKKKRRVAIRIDMTPMVDVAFLLLTFFMLTTVFRKPQTMEINLPPKDAKVEMAESNLLTLRIDEKNTVYWNYGIDIPKKMSMDNLHKFLIGEAQKNPKLVVLVKIDRKSKYHVMIDVLDELNLDSITRFSLAPMNEIDQKEMSKAI
ncbi:ExbD/TolR family protein [Melioribacteraceae bacterium 4301-Me]|uniref:ExbD/TolR family protein n=1 Tax=Pyranulibacter aquaticus TaxID=3163344 RepID=UPI00359BC963